MGVMNVDAVESLSLALGGEETAPLDPAILRPQAERAVADLLSQGTSENTNRSYSAALRYWAAWHFARYRQPISLPTERAVVIQFIMDHAEREDKSGRLVTDLPSSLATVLLQAGFKGKPGAPALSTLVHRVSVLSRMHQSRALENPCRHPVVSDLLSRTRHEYEVRGPRSKPKAALVKGPLELLLATCDKSLRGKRDRALLLFAWASGGRRRSEVASARCEDLKSIGIDFVFTLEKVQSVEAVHRPEDEKPIRGRAAAALRDWLAASNVRQGPIFRRIRKGDRVAEGLSASAVRDIVKARCKMAGLHGDFSAQSLRSGFVTEAGNQGASVGDIMSMTGHASASTVLRYHRRAATMNNPAARLLEQPLQTASRGKSTRTRT